MDQMCNTSHSRYQQASTTAATGDTVGNAQQTVVCGVRRAADDNTTRIHSMSKQQKKTLAESCNLQITKNPQSKNKHADIIYKAYYKKPSNLEENGHFYCDFHHCC
jgi:hypothetical protein